MGVTVVLSGPVLKRAQAVSQLRQAGLIVEDSDESHGFEALPDESFITAHGNHPDHALNAVRHLDWQLRRHHHRSGDWAKAGQFEADPMQELAKLKAQLRAQGIILPGE